MPSFFLLPLQAWAEHRGKYKKGDKTDAATWKTRLRCALNKLPDIKELKEQSNLESNSPYRVYQLLPEPDKCKCIYVLYMRGCSLCHMKQYEFVRTHVMRVAKSFF